MISDPNAQSHLSTGAQERHAEKRCGNCRWARPLAPVSWPEPADPGPPPKGFWHRAVVGDTGYWMQRHRRTRWMEQVNRVRECVMCGRFPQTVEKSKRDVCGEFSPCEHGDARSANARDDATVGNGPHQQTVSLTRADPPPTSPEGKG